MFYNHLGFYGENLKIAMLEKYIDQCGKTEEFRRVFEEKKGKSWIDQRKAFAFNGKFIVPTLMEVLGMSEEDAKNWFNDKNSVEFSIAQLVDDIKAYVSSKPKNFRLLFMIDEAGQYVGTDTDMLLNLQSLTEKIGSECGGKVWVICTGQEAIDEIIKVRADEFSRIQARFKTRLSLTSSSVDEVIQKRILKKKPEVTPKLVELYNENDSVLRNLFSFTDSVLDIKGYSGPQEFADNYPFVPYQFIIMQKVFSEIRKHGNAGKHFSGGERSMLSGFQEAAQKVQNSDEYTLVPFFHFYDTVHTFLDGSIRRVIERCQKAADSAAGIEQYDVEVLKLLYLIRYVDDIKATLDNIVILMADDIRTDKITLREAVRNSLDRLMSQNYIGRTGDTYNFLTDEEQDIQREIKSTPVDTASIVERIAQMVYGDIYTSKKFRYGKYDFAFDQMVDGVTVGAVTGGMKLRFLTVATDAVEKSDMRLMTESMNQAIVVLNDTPYYESLENAMKIRKYVKQRNVAQLPKSVQDIIRDQQDEANAYDQTAMDALKKAIEGAEYYVDGEHLTFKGGDAKSKIDQALEYLVAHVYSDLDLITKNAETDDDIVTILSGGGQQRLDGFTHNQDAAAKVEEYLEMQAKKMLPTSMADIQSRYQAIPYGWKEIDVAAVMALLIHDQKVTVKYAGNTIQPGNPKLPDMLRKKTEIGKTIVSKRQSVTAANMKEAKEFLRDYFDVMDVPDDEDGLISFIVDKFTAQKAHYEELLGRYDSKKYPDKYFNLGKNLNQRDTIAVRKMVGGYIKLLYPDGEYTKEQLEEILRFALEMRRRVKEQLKKLGGMEFYDVNFSYIDNETFEENYVSVPEQGGGKLIPEGICNPGQVYTISQGKSGMLGVFRLESQMLPGSGKFERTGLSSDGKCKEAANTAFNYLKANGNRISGSISTINKDYIINYQDLQGLGMTEKLALPTLIALCSIALSKPTISSLAVLGEISIAGTMLKVDELANSLQVCLDSGAKKVLLPITSAADLGAVPSDLIGSFNIIFYSSAEDAVYKALGVE